MTTFFISDLHLSAAHPDTTELFLKFLKEDAKEAEALYILGDFFEAWIGDDILDPHEAKIIHALANYTKQGTPVYFMHGNRDFLIGHSFAIKSGCSLIKDPTLITLYGKKVLLCHGDALCTLDKTYQYFRKGVRHPLIKKIYLNLPQWLRRKIANRLRNHSPRNLYLDHSKHLNPKWDVTISAVNQIMQKFQSDILIHGHTHKAGIHEFVLDEKPVTRIVLGDWTTTGKVLAFSSQKLELQEVRGH